MGNDPDGFFGQSLNAEISRITALFHRAEELAAVADLALDQELNPETKAEAVSARREASSARLQAQLAWAQLRQKMDTGARLNDMGACEISDTKKPND